MKNTFNSDDNKIIQSFIKFEERSYKKYHKLYEKIKNDREYIAGNQSDDTDKLLIGTDAANCRLNIVANGIRTVVNSYMPHQYKWHYSDSNINSAGIAFLDDVDNSTAAIEALTNAVGTGLGVMVFSTDYATDGSIKPILYSIPDVTNVRLDPNSTKLNGSDALEAAIIELKSRNTVKKEFGFDYLEDEPLVDISEDYDKKEYLPVITYYKKEDDGVYCYKLVNSNVVNVNVLPYTYVPVVPVFGEQSWNSSNEMTYVGITEQMKSIQRLVNYVYRQLILRSSKSPKNTWSAEAESIEGFEQYYKNADKTLNPLLMYNGWSADGKRQLTPPTRLSNEIQFADLSQLMQNALGLTNTLIGIPATGLETEVAKTATEALLNDKTFNNNIRAYIQHLKYSLQVIGLLFAEESSNMMLYGKIKVDMIEGPDAAMEKQEARVQLQSYAALITDENDKKALLKAQCMIENDNEYIVNFARMLTPQQNPMDQQAQQLIAQADNEIKTRDQQILELQKTIEDLKNQQQLQAYSLEKEIELSKLKHAQEMEKLAFEAQLKEANPAEQAKTQAEIVKAEASVEKEALSLQKAQMNAAEDIIRGV